MLGGNTLVGQIFPIAFKLLEKSKYDASSCIVDWANMSKFEVKCMYGDQFIVDLATKFYSSRRWDWNNIPCLHVMACMYKKKKKNLDQFSLCMSITASKYMKTFTNS